MGDKGLTTTLDLTRYTSEAHLDDWIELERCKEQLADKDRLLKANGKRVKTLVERVAALSERVTESSTTD